MSQAIREHLCRNGGRSTREAIRQELHKDQRLRQRLEDGQGLERLLRNLQYSGSVILDGHSVAATPRTLRITSI